MSATATCRGMDRLERDFWAFHYSHPQVYEELVELARSLKSRGHKTYSIKALYEVVRFNRTIAAKRRQKFLINNNFTAFYARLIMKENPDLAGFFTTRCRTAPLRDPFIDNSLPSQFHV